MESLHEKTYSDNCRLAVLLTEVFQKYLSTLDNIKGLSEMTLF